MVFELLYPCCVFMFIAILFVTFCLPKLGGTPCGATSRVVGCNNQACPPGMTRELMFYEIAA